MTKIIRLLFMFSLMVWLKGGMAAMVSQITCNSATSTEKITFTFNKAYEAGQYANGDWWVVGPVTIIAISPGWDGDGNGWDINPVRQLTGSASLTENGWAQTLDSQVSKFGTSRSLPYTAQPDETVISTTKRRPCTSAIKDAQNCIMYAAALTIVGATVPDPGTAFRPPYCGTWDIIGKKKGVPNKPTYRTTDIRWDRIPDLDAAQAPVKHDIAAIRNTYANLHLDFIEHNHMRWVRPFDAFNRGAGTGEYGGYFGLDTPNHLLRMALDDFDPVNDSLARQAVINFIQTGIDYYHLSVDADRVHWGCGGHGLGAMMPVFAAAYLLNDQTMISWLQSSDAEIFLAAKQLVYRSDKDIAYADGLTAVPEGMAAFQANKPVLYGQRWGNPRKYNGNYDGVCDCETWTAKNVDGLCRDPHHYIDGQASFCDWPVERGGSDYERMNFGPIKAMALAFRLFGGEQEAAFPEAWEYAARRTYHGFWSQPDYAFQESFIGKSQPTSARCQSGHGTGANVSSSGKTYYPGDKTTNALQTEAMWNAFWDLPGAPVSGYSAVSPVTFTVSVSPLPMQEAVWFDLRENRELKLRQVTISDSKGNAVRHIPVKTGDGMAQWDGTNNGGIKTKPGVYFYSLNCGKNVINGKLVKMR